MDITLLGNPASTNNIYKSACRGPFPHVYMTETGRSLKESYQWQIKSQYKGKPLAGEIDLRVELFFKDSRTRDIDNYNKVLLDACSGLLWDDDSQIVSLLIVKNIDKKNPRVELRIN